MHVLGVQRALLRPEQVGTHLSEVRHPVVDRDATCVPRASRRGYLRQRPTVVVTDDDVEPASTSEDEDEDEDDLHESDDETEADIEIVPDLPKPLTEVP